MKIFVSPYRSASINLALEEWLFSHFTENIVFLYVNNNSVVVGKHQNAFQEANSDFLEANAIPLFRRLSGGGAVFHDLGNVNISLIQNNDSEHKINFSAWINPVVEALKSLGVDPQIGSRNDLFYADKKISGTASHIYKNRVMHHGTLLFDSNLELLRSSLSSDNINYQGKAIKSIRNSVDNILPHLEKPMEMNDFVDYMMQFLQRYFNAETFEFNKTFLPIIDEIIEERYSKWDWNYGYSPDFQASYIDNNERIFIYVRKGYVVSVVGSRIISMVGKRFDPRVCKRQ